MTIYLNGEYIRARGQAAECAVSFTGGVFETMRAYGGRIFKLSEHIKRLFMSAKFIGMSILYTSEELEEICCKVLEDAMLKDAQVRISIRDKMQNVECGGSTSGGMRNLMSQDEDLLIIVKQLPQISCEKGEVIITSSLIKQPPLPQAKSSDFLSGVLARAEAYVDNPFEIVFLNRHGYVTEGTVSNIFIVRDEVVITPPVYLGLLNGISRQCVLEIATQAGMKTMQVPFTRYDLWTADEVFLTNSTIEILPVSFVDGRKIENRDKTVGGEITRVLQEGYRQMVNRDASGV
ncbi:aminotransferase class IV [Candidatus Desantisbacteria bacterium]|nr:aminotransferase class IV [Candidatus Desantisbacteria bacterium]